MHERIISRILTEKEQRKKDLKSKEDKDIDKFISLKNQVKILSNIANKTSQFAQTVLMLIPKPSLYYNGKCSISFANLEYLKKAQWEKPCLYNVKYDKNDLTNLFALESEEIIHLVEESRSKLSKEGIAAALFVLITEASQSRQHDTLVRLPMDIRLKIDLENQSDLTSHLPQSLFDVGSGRVSIVTVNTF
ncbi:hypothetical protein Tco_0967122 [Tanacetum coccineum]